MLLRSLESRLKNKSGSHELVKLMRDTGYNCVRRGPE